MRSVHLPSQVSRRKPGHWLLLLQVWVHQVREGQKPGLTLLSGPKKSPEEMFRREQSSRRRKSMVPGRV